MTVKHFIKRVLKRLIFLALILSAISFLAQAVAPIVTNEMALMQMESSVGSFMVTQTYPAFRSVLALSMWVITGVTLCLIGKDTYYFIKSIKKEKESNQL